MNEIVFKYSGFRRGLKNGVEENALWCPNHFHVEFEVVNGVLTSWRGDVEIAQIGEIAFQVQSPHCLIGRADDEIQIGKFLVRAELFLISPDGFSALNMTHFSAVSEEYFHCENPVSLEVDARGRAIFQCETKSTPRLFGREYSLGKGRCEMEIAPFAMRRDWNTDAKK